MPSRSRSRPSASQIGPRCGMICGAWASSTGWAVASSPGIERIVRFTRRPHEDGVEAPLPLEMRGPVQDLVGGRLFLGPPGAKPEDNVAARLEVALLQPIERKSRGARRQDGTWDAQAAKASALPSAPAGRSIRSTSCREGSGGSGSLRPGYFEASEQTATVRLPFTDRPRLIARGDSSPLATITQSKDSPRSEKPCQSQSQAAPKCETRPRERTPPVHPQHDRCGDWNRPPTRCSRWRAGEFRRRERPS